MVHLSRMSCTATAYQYVSSKTLEDLCFKWRQFI